MLKSIDKQSGESVETRSWRRKESYSGKDLQKRKVLSLEWKSEKVVDDESGESMEPMEEVPLERLNESELGRLVRGWRREAGSWFQRRGEERDKGNTEIKPQTIGPDFMKRAKCF